MRGAAVHWIIALLSIFIVDGIWLVFNDLLMLGFRPFCTTCDSTTLSFQAVVWAAFPILFDLGLLMWAWAQSQNPQYGQRLY